MVDALLALKTSGHGCCPAGIFKIKEKGSPDIAVVIKGFFFIKTCTKERKGLQGAMCILAAQ